VSDLSREQVLKALAAGQFSAAAFLYLDVLLTVDFGAMGIAAPDEARIELQRLLKTMNTWLSERKLPVAWIAAIERAKAGNLHAHVAVHVPGMRREEGGLRGTRHRTHFRRWARDTVARRIGRSVPRIVNVRCSLVPSLIAHWVCVTYLLKGYDRSALLVDQRNSSDGTELLLADILPFPYRDPGQVGLAHRLFISGNLGPARRCAGLPRETDCILRGKPDLNAIQLVPGADAVTSAPPALRSAPRPFRAAVEDGQFDVRRIYGMEFANFVTGVTRGAGEGDIETITREALLEHLLRLGI
jgi:hypothetical protein